MFLRLGVIAFGGPAAHIALMREELVLRRRWVDERRFLDLLSVTQLIPGPNSTELAMHLGMERAGWRGWLAAGVCFITPAALMVGILAHLYAVYGTTPAAGGLLRGVQPVVLAIVVHALWGLARAALRADHAPDQGRQVRTTRLALGRALAAATVLVLFGVGVHELILLLAAGVLFGGARALARPGGGPHRPVPSRAAEGSRRPHLAPGADPRAGRREHHCTQGAAPADRRPLPATRDNRTPQPRGRPPAFGTPWLPRRTVAGPVTVPAAVAGAVSTALVTGPGMSLGSTLPTLFWTFLKIGSVLYGSGYVLLAFLRRDFVERLGWLTDQQLLDAVAVGQFTPGPLFTTATFIGYLTGGWVGAVAATVAIFLPAFVLVVAVRPLADGMRRSPVLASALDGLNAASVGLMAGVTLQLARQAIRDPWTAGFFLVALVLLGRTRISSVWLMAAGAAAGLLLTR